MKSSALRMGVFALGIFLFNWQPAEAGCGQTCAYMSTCEASPGNPDWGCFQEPTYCWEFICGRRASFDPATVEKISAAAQAGDMGTVTRLAAAVGQPFRLHSGGKLVYDGFALAGLKGPGIGDGAERLAACGDAAAPGTDAAAATPEGTAAAADDVP